MPMEGTDPRQVENGKQLFHRELVSTQPIAFNITFGHSSIFIVQTHKPTIKQIKKVLTTDPSIKHPLPQPKVPFPSTSTLYNPNLPPLPLPSPPTHPRKTRIPCSGMVLKQHSLPPPPPSGRLSPTPNIMEAKKNITIHRTAFPPEIMHKKN